MFILKKGHQPGVYVPLRALFLVLCCFRLNNIDTFYIQISTCKLCSGTSPLYLTWFKLIYRNDPKFSDR